MHTFDSTFAVGAELPSFTQQEVKDEPMFFNADFDFAYRHGGPITRAFLSTVGEEFDVPHVVDSRVHMLMPGWFPCIPGWHHDDIPRTRSDGQPDYDTPAYEARHCIALINGEVAPTEFAYGRTVLPAYVPGTGNLYKHWHDVIEQQIADGTLRRERIPSNRLVYFDCYSMHQGVPAVSNGWRWFGRASFQTGRAPTNEIRRQVQVYLTSPHDGW